MYFLIKWPKKTSTILPNEESDNALSKNNKKNSWSRKRFAWLVYSRDKQIKISGWQFRQWSAVNGGRKVKQYPWVRSMNVLLCFAVYSSSFGFVVFFQRRCDVTVSFISSVPKNIHRRKKNGEKNIINTEFHVKIEFWAV